MGFLPNYPYHLISDKEMFDAFMRNNGFFATYYPCPDPEFQLAYNGLRDCIVTNITKFQAGEETELPDWIYSYMIMNPVTFNSPEEDIAYICDLANIDRPDILAVFTPQVASICYEISKKWLLKQPSTTDKRPPTMFGEAHVIKSLRLMQANVLLDVDLKEGS